MSKKITMSFLTLAIILFLFTSCKTDEKIYSYVNITGDVENQYVLDDYSEEFSWNEIEKKDNTYNGVLLKELVNYCNPKSEDFWVLLVSNDGLMARLNGNELEECYVVNNENGWCSVTFNHPVNSNIRDLQNIIIINKEIDLDKTVNIVSKDENIYSITPGDFYLKNYIIYNYLDGETSVNGSNTIKLYKQKKLISVEDILNGKVDEEIKRILIMTKDGGYYYSSDLGYLQLDGNKINFIIPEDRLAYYDIVGIMINPPQTSVMDTYYDSLYYLEKEQKVMILFVDGFGYHQYKYAVKNDYAPFIASLKEAKIANTVYKPVTNSGYAAMVTGVAPIDNGILDRSYRQPKVPTIFEEAIEMNKKTMLVEGESNIIEAGLTPIFSVDNNNDNETDEEVFDNALKAISEKPDLIMVHFHGVDDRGHKYGDLSDNTMEKIKTVDEYIKTLSSKWDGKIIIVADHGMHKKGSEGTHGYFRYEDLIIPYLIYN